MAFTWSKMVQHVHGQPAKTIHNIRASTACAIENDVEWTEFVVNLFQKITVPLFAEADMNFSGMRDFYQLRVDVNTDDKRIGVKAFLPHLYRISIEAANL